MFGVYESACKCITSVVTVTLPRFAGNELTVFHIGIQTPYASFTHTRYGLISDVLEYS